MTFGTEVGPMYGVDNLAAFFTAQVNAIKTGAAFSAHMVMDSRGSANLTTGFRPNEVLELASLGYPFDVTCETHAGQNTYVWANGVAQAYAATNPTDSLLIMGMGLNENVTGATGGAQSTAATEDNLSVGIQAVRDVRPDSTLSILLVGQTPANNWNPAYNQTTDAMRVVNAIMKDVASDMNCAFYDSLELFNRAHDVGWMDQLPVPAYGDGNVHPGDAMSLEWWGEVADELFAVPFKVPAGNMSVVYPTILNSWVEWSSGYAPRSVLMPDRTVRLRSMIKSGVVAAYTPLFMLPVGFRPTINEFFFVPTSPTTGQELQILSNGIVRLSAPHPGLAGTYISTDVSFLTL